MVKHIFKIIILVTILCSFFSCKNENNKLQSLPLVDWKAAHSFYLENIDQSLAYLDSLSFYQANNPKAKYYFRKAREAFKKGEAFGSYLNPDAGHRANGPALPVVTEDTQRVLNPIGLQKIEETIYEGGVSDTVYKIELSYTKGLLAVIKKNISKRELNAERFFIATHQQLMRIVGLAIAGFDTPISGLGLNETQLSLQSLWDVYNLSIRPLILEKNSFIDQQFKKEIKDAILYIEHDKNFETFDRYTFLRDFMNPITRSWVTIRKTAAIWEPLKSTPYNFDAATFFEKDAFNVAYFTQITNRNPSKDQIALGKKLFFDKSLSKSNKMACATCHQPDKAYADGLVTNFDNQGSLLKRNTPTLINSVFQKGLFWDGRSANLMDQISGVITNENEFDSSVHEFSDTILKNPEYEILFKNVFGSRKRTNEEVIKALSSYIATLNAFDSKFDKNIRGEEDTFTSEEKLGLNLFMGKALCATCHFMPLTNGTVPPFFTETEKEVIGVPETFQNKELDDDFGFYFMYNLEVQKGMFKTPTVRNSEVTAPYMHNGAYTSLDQVMDFYNKGGGAGLGFDLEYQTLPFDQLNLTEKEQKAIIAFIKTLTDTKVE